MVIKTFSRAVMLGALLLSPAWAAADYKDTVIDKKGNIVKPCD